MRTLTRRVHDSSKEHKKVQVWIIEKRSLKVREMQEPQEYAQTQVSEERVSQAKKRNTEKNIVIVLRWIMET